MKRVLVVDDNDDVRNATARVLRFFLGCEVLTAEDGFRALDLLDDEPIDLVLLDMSMPGMTGLEVLERMALEWGEPPIPVVMYTAHMSYEERQRALALGVMDIMGKGEAGAHSLTAQVKRYLAVEAEG